MIMIRFKLMILLIVAVLASDGLTAGEAESVETSANLNPAYIMALRPGGEARPNVAQHGGQIEHEWSNFVLIRIPEQALAALAEHPRVKYLQRVNESSRHGSSGRSALRTSPASVSSSSGVVPPSQMSTTGVNWQSGVYSYDGAGNIKQIGYHGYGYDQLGRLRSSSTVSDAWGNPTLTHSETYRYDGFGNMVERTTDGFVMPLDTDPETNRLIPTGLTNVMYDGVGNVVRLGDKELLRDAQSMIRQKSIDGTLFQEFMIYGPGNERIASCRHNECKWTIRGPGQRVLRKFISDGIGNGSVPDFFVWTEDYVYRGGSMVAAQREIPEGGKLHFALDHLGTPKVMTNQGGLLVSRHENHPFGMEITTRTQEGQEPFGYPVERMFFTGHERDHSSPAEYDNTDYLDYMHARYYSPVMGRFLSVDPGGFYPERPQSWNRYQYASNNPIGRIDPDGRDDIDAKYYPGGFGSPGACSGSASDCAAHDTFVKSLAVGLVATTFLLPGPEDLAFLGVARLATTVHVRAAMHSLSASTRLEGKVAHALGNLVTDFKKTVEVSGRAVTEIDVQTSKYIIETTVGKGRGKVAQLERLKSVAEGRQVIIYGPNITRGAAKELEKNGAKVVRSIDDLEKLVRQ